MNSTFKNALLAAFLIIGSCALKAQSSCTPTISSTTTMVCQGYQATLTASGASSYTWLSSGAPVVSQSVAVGPGLYTVTASSGSCTASAAITIYIAPPLVIQSTQSSPAICHGETVTATASGGSTYSWTSGNTNYTGNTIIVSPTVSTTYTVTGFTSSCQGSTAVTVIVNNCITGIPQAELLNDIISVSPNPGSDVFLISAEKLAGPVLLEVYGITGKLVQKMQVEKQGSWLHMEDNPKGIYTLRLMINGSPAGYKRIVKN